MLEVSGVRCQELAPLRPDTRNLTPETYNYVKDFTG
jgi:hypothetical protein